MKHTHVLCSFAYYFDVRLNYIKHLVVVQHRPTQWSGG